jgi:AmmeMemoRadiSam system protein A
MGQAFSVYHRALPVERVAKPPSEADNTATGGDEVALELELARLAVERYVEAHEVIAPPKDLSPEMAERRAVFVSLRIGSELRGCIGTLSPTKPTLAEEIIANAISAATSDPRFLPVSLHELPGLNYEVDILTPPEPISGESELDPERYGVVVEAGGRRGVLLPGIAGVTTVARQIAIAREKAGLSSSENICLSRFTVTRFRESPADR